MKAVLTIGFFIFPSHKHKFFELFASLHNPGILFLFVFITFKQKEAVYEKDAMVPPVSDVYVALVGFSSGVK